MLEPLGLTRQEQDLYESLVSRRPVAAAELIDESTALARLVELDLVTLVDTDPAKYVVLPPDIALDVLARRRERELADARRKMVELTVRFHGSTARREPADLVEVLHGDQEIAQIMPRLLLSARNEVCGWDAPPYRDDPNQVNQLELDQLKRGVTFRVVYDRRGSVDRPGRLAALIQGIADGEQARVGDVPLKMTISDAPLAFVPFDVRATRHQTALLIHDPTMVAGLAALFELYWDRAVPLATYDGQQPAADRPTAEERDLLALLMSGFTDLEMAAHLGWSERTVRKHIDGMRHRLDADTRFQAGYQAVLRGWLEHRG
ncbi:regulatory LuxR family protein [Kribbella sp. VKM Ac-2527]|uniref:Regulatory LuxR family protein n=1 Tax=Kribbella caucasensis TaxID=2512215 RepID=A0A4R6JLP3_9ACTN|nr:LuxR C-terminal-related transcriptional regulator [Kribbella sp. VKM Ac-2527]TDO35616.1 regulatory LuxR family protein [Kribbella sp. VKM Ac-2527]